jgi:hypothetical protein
MADKTPSLKELANRVARLEKESNRETTPQKAEVSSGVGTCKLPLVPKRILGSDVSPVREEIIRYIEKKWVNGTKLRYYFFEDAPFKGEASNEDLVREAFETWAGLGIGLMFEEVSNVSDAEVRIGFRQGDGAWSYVGRDVIDIPGQYERTMNFGWDLTQDPRGGGLDTPLHEIGHTLGFPHAHQTPFSGIVWDEDAVYREFEGSPNFWSREQTYHNVLRKLSRSEVEGSQWDPNSIMQYSFGPGLIVEPAEFRNGLNPADGLSETDIAEVKKFYPPTDPKRYRKLSPFELEFLSVGPGEQKDFLIEPDRSEEFTIQTFGRSDSVMVLFEDVNGEYVFMAGDDDSGTSTNAKITTRLVSGRKYLLRIRLYANWAIGDTAIMMW